MMKSPGYLKVGDKVGIVAPARSITPGQIEACLTVLKSWGLEVIFGKHLFDVFHQFGGKDIHRADDLQTMLDDKNIMAIFCARGGYGTMRIIDNLCWDGLKKNPKWLVGFSDITVIHSHIQRKAGLQTLHAVMPFNFYHNNLTKDSIESLRKALFGETLEYTWKGHELNRTGHIKGIVAGGNLSMLYAMIDSPSEFDYEGKILFLEDLDEYLYHIERMMLALRRAGRLSRLGGLIVGGMTDMKDNTIPFGWDAFEIIADVVKDFDYPVSFGFPAGHGDENMSLYLGREAEFICDNESRLMYK
ncbi:MAG: LD-carboxypeptidase [Bacteroidales bacterium]